MASSGFPNTNLTNPGDIRKAHRDLQVSAPPAPDLDLSEATATLNPTDVLPVATKVMKLAAHATESGPEAWWGIETWLCRVYVRPWETPEDPRAPLVSPGRFACVLGRLWAPQLSTIFCSYLSLVLVNL